MFQKLKEKFSDALVGGGKPATPFLVGSSSSSSNNASSSPAELQLAAEFSTAVSFRKATLCVYEPVAKVLLFVGDGQPLVVVGKDSCCEVIPVREDEHWLSMIAVSGTTTCLLLSQRLIQFADYGDLDAQLCVWGNSTSNKTSRTNTFALYAKPGNLFTTMHVPAGFLHGLVGSASGGHIRYFSIKSAEFCVFDICATELLQEMSPKTKLAGSGYSDGGNDGNNNDDAVVAIASYPSDPNAFLAVTTQSRGVLKWYVLEKRLSAYFVLPDEPATTQASSNAPVTKSAELGHCGVTRGGGFVIAFTVDGTTAYIWNEKSGKRKDRRVPLHFKIDLMATSSCDHSLADTPPSASQRLWVLQDRRPVPAKGSSASSSASPATDEDVFVFLKPDGRGVAIVRCSCDNKALGSINEYPFGPTRSEGFQEGGRVLSASPVFASPWPADQYADECLRLCCAVEQDGVALLQLHSQLQIFTKRLLSPLTFHTSGDEGMLLEDDAAAARGGGCCAILRTNGFSLLLGEGGSGGGTRSANDSSSASASSWAGLFQGSKACVSPFNDGYSSLTPQDGGGLLMQALGGKHHPQSVTRLMPVGNAACQLPRPTDCADTTSPLWNEWFKEQPAAAPCADFYIPFGIYGRMLLVVRQRRHVITISLLDVLQDCHVHIWQTTTEMIGLGGGNTLLPSSSLEESESTNMPVITQAVIIYGSFECPRDSNLSSSLASAPARVFVEGKGVSVLFRWSSGDVTISGLGTSTRQQQDDSMPAALGTDHDDQQETAQDELAAAASPSIRTIVFPSFLFPSQSTASDCEFLVSNIPVKEGPAGANSKVVPASLRRVALLVVAMSDGSVVLVDAETGSLVACKRQSSNQTRSATSGAPPSQQQKKREAAGVVMPMSVACGSWSTAASIQQGLMTQSLADLSGKKRIHRLGSGRYYTHLLMHSGLDPLLIPRQVALVVPLCFVAGTSPPEAASGGDSPQHDERTCTERQKVLHIIIRNIFGAPILALRYEVDEHRAHYYSLECWFSSATAQSSLQPSSSPLCKFIPSSATSETMHHLRLEHDDEESVTRGYLVDGKGSSKLLHEFSTLGGEDSVGSITTSSSTSARKSLRVGSIDVEFVDEAYAASSSVSVVVEDLSDRDGHPIASIQLRPTTAAPPLATSVHYAETLIHLHENRLCHYDVKELASGPSPNIPAPLRCVNVCDSSAAPVDQYVVSSLVSPRPLQVVNIPCPPPPELVVRLSLSDGDMLSDADEELTSCIDRSYFASSTSKILLVVAKDSIPATAPPTLVDDAALLLVLGLDSMQLALPPIALPVPTVEQLASIEMCGQLHMYVTGHNNSSLTHLVLDKAATTAQEIAASTNSKSLQATSASFHCSWYTVPGTRKLRPFGKYGEYANGRGGDSSAAAVSSWSCMRLLRQLPPKPNNLASTQQEQGFFKRLVTASFDDQLMKVEQVLKPTLQVTFEDLTERIMLMAPPSAAVDTRSKAQRERDALLQNNKHLRGSERRGGGNVHSDVNEVKNAMSENQILLQERGEKIDRVQTKSQELANETQQFAELCKQLKEKQRSSWF